MKKEALKIDSKKVFILLIFLVAGVLFFALGEYISNSKSAEDDSFHDDAYTVKLEERLCRILEDMEGVESVTVMITLDGTEENQYVSPNSAEASSLLSSVGTGEKESLLKSKTLPKVRGVSVVCRGAKHDKIREKITNLIASTLNLNKNQIYVTE